MRSLLARSSWSLHHCSKILLVSGILLGAFSAYPLSNSLMHPPASGGETAQARESTTSVTMTGVESSVAPPHAGFWETLQIIADEVEGYSSLTEMAAKADHVVIGTISNFRLHRRIFGDSPENVVHMVAVDLAVIEVVRGPVPERKPILEFLLPGAPEYVEARVRQQAATMPTGPMLFFLRHKGGEEQGVHRIVNSLGLWTQEGAHIRAPLALEVRVADVASPARAQSAEHAARELAARPAHLRGQGAAELLADEQVPAEEEHDDDTTPAAPYADELADIHSIEELAKHVAP